MMAVSEKRGAWYIAGGQGTGLSHQQIAGATVTTESVMPARGVRAVGRKVDSVWCADKGYGFHLGALIQKWQ